MNCHHQLPRRLRRDRVGTGEEACSLLNSFLYDLMLLEGLPPWLEVLNRYRRLRQVGNPVLILLALTDPRVDDRFSAQTSQHIQTLESGADVCLTHPVDEWELLAPIQALARRGGEKLAP